MHIVDRIEYSDRNVLAFFDEAYNSSDIGERRVLDNNVIFTVRGSINVFNINIEQLIRDVLQDRRLRDAEIDFEAFVDSGVESDLVSFYAWAKRAGYDDIKGRVHEWFCAEKMKG